MPVLRADFLCPMYTMYFLYFLYFMRILCFLCLLYPPHYALHTAR